MCDVPVVNSDMNSHLDKCLSESKGIEAAEGDEIEGPSVSDPRRVNATVDEEELSEGWKEYWNSNDEERPDETLLEKENVAASDTTSSQASKSGVDQDDDDLLTLPPESSLEAATRMKTRAVAATNVSSRYDFGGTTKFPFPRAFL